MANLKIPYETHDDNGVFLDLEVPDKNLWIECIPQEPEPIKDFVSAVYKAVESPIEGPSFSELIKGGKKLVFITENQHRAAPIRDFLFGLVKKAKQAGCDVSIMIGCGVLPVLTRKEMEVKLGADLVNTGIPIYCNNVLEPENYRYTGMTSFGTPLYVHKSVADAEIIISMSTTQAFKWGYGGSGMIIPSATNRETIEISHLRMLGPDCYPGNNECYNQLDKYEAMEVAGVNMGINMIVDTKDRVIFVNAGPPVKSHKAAVESYNQIYQFSVPKLKQQKADIAITGNFAPMGNLFFQVSWALPHCIPAIREGGIMIIACPCPGYGNWGGFARMEVLKEFLPVSKENQGKAIQHWYNRNITGDWFFGWYAVYEVMTQREVWVVTNKENLPACKEIGLTAFESIQEAFAQAIKKCGNDAKVAFIPYGRYTVIK